MPGHDLALLNSSLQSIVIQRPITLLRNILFSRPDHLDGSLNLLSDARGFANAVGLEPSPKATANIVVVDRDFGRFDPEHLRRDALRKTRDLRTHPYLASAIVHVDGAVHRLHGGVSEKRELVGRFKEHAGLERFERIAFADRAPRGDLVTTRSPRREDPERPPTCDRPPPPQDHQGPRPAERQAAQVRPPDRPLTPYRRGPASLSVWRTSFREERHRSHKPSCRWSCPRCQCVALACL